MYVCMYVCGPSIILVVVAVPLCCVENCYAAHKAECDKMKVKKKQYLYIRIHTYVSLNVVYILNI